MNKDKELAILKMVYDIIRFETVRHQESPDFALQYAKVNQAFGVEITELYYSESDARLRNLPDYTDHLLGGGKFLHRVDTKHIKVDTISFFDPDGTPKASDIMAVASRIPSSEDYAELLSSIVERKNNKTNDYCTGLSHVNLIVADMEYFFNYTDPKELYKYLFTPSLKKTITITNFHEVFLVTQVKKDRKVFIPLRMLLVLGQIYLFDWATSDYYPDLIYESSEARTRLFAEFLGNLGHKVNLRETHKGLGIQVGSNIIHTIPGEGTTILDHVDQPILNKILPVEKSEHSDKLSEAFLAFYEEYSQSGTFSASIAFDVVNSLA